MKLIKLWLPVVLWAGVIFYLSGVPSLETSIGGPWDFILRKCAHVTEYFILTLLLWRAFKGSFKLNAVYNSLWIIIISILYAISDEIHQSFVPTRVCSLRDVLIDTIGILTFIILLRIEKTQRIFKKLLLEKR